MLNKKLDELASQYAIGEVLSQYLTTKEFDEAMEVWEETDEMPENILVWEPFENFDRSRLIGTVENLELSARELIRKAFEIQGVKIE